MTDRISDLQLFVDAAQLGSLSAAGRKHGLSPAAASACILRMEAALGTRLFHRTTRQLRLTPEGELYRQHCRQALAALAEGSASLQAGMDEVRGRVRLSAPSDLGRTLLLGMLAEFQAAHPQLELCLSLSDVTANLVGEEIDLAVRYGEPADSTLVARRLAGNRRVVCASPDLLARTGTPAHPRELAALPALVLVTGAGPLHEWRYREGGERTSVRVHGRHETNDGEVLRRWARHGLGFAYKSALDVMEDLDAGRLVTVLDAYFVDEAPLHLLYHRAAVQPPRLRKLIDFLVARFQAFE
ncbi:MAG: LysR family transcriptional regulator [Gammaproteobacteria bacterium]